MKEIPVTQPYIALNARVAETGGPMGGARLANAMGEDLQRRRDIYQNQLIENAYLQGQVTINEEVNRLSNDFATDPDSLAMGVEEFSEGFLDEIFDPELRARLELQISKHSQTAIAQATARKNALIDDENRFRSLQTLDQLQTEIANTSVGMLDSDPLVALATKEQLQEQMARGHRILNSVKSDGMPLFSANERSSTLLALRDGSYKEAVKAWFSTQENRLAAAQDWLDGNVNITLPTENDEVIEINLRETLPETSRAKIDNEIMSTMRDQIAIKNYQINMQEKMDKELAEQTHVDHMTRLQNAAMGDTAQGLSVAELEEAEQIYLKGGKEKDYLALRKTMIEGSTPIIDGSMKNTLFEMAYKGLDPTELGRVAVQQGRLDWATVQQASTIFKSVSGPSSNIQGFYISQLQRALGGMNENLDISAQETITRAVIEMQSQFGELQQAGELNDNKARDVFNRILENNSNLTLEDRVIARTPQFIPKSLVGQKATAESAKDFAQRINDHFVEKYKGDIEQIQQDPDYLSAKRWIRDYTSQVRNTFTKVE